MDWLAYPDAVWVGAVLAVTELIKRAFQVPPRWVPVVPLGVALVIGCWMALEGSWEGWWPFVRAAVNNALRVGPLAMASYKVWRTTIVGRE